MVLLSYFCVLIYVCATFGDSGKAIFADIDDELDDILKGSMGSDPSNQVSIADDMEFKHHNEKFVSERRRLQKRKKRYVFQETMDEVVTNLVEEVEILKENIRLLEKDNAQFQQTVATVMKVTDDRLSAYSCSCLKYILRDEGIFPCELATQVTSVITQTSTVVEVRPTSTFMTPSAQPFAPDSVQYLDSPIPKPLEPSLVCVSYYGNKFYRYIFGNESVEVMDHERRVTHAVTFDPVDEKVIWSSFSPAVIYASSVDGSNFTTLIRDVLSYGLEVDADRRLLFLSTVTPRHSVCVLDLDSEGYQIISNVGKYGRPTRLTLDTKNESIYIAFRGRILKLSYDGRQESVFVRGKFITTLSFDSTNDILYFADRITIQRVVDTKGVKGKSEMVIKFKPKTGSFPSDIFVDGDNLYLGYKFKPDVEVMSIENKTLTVLAHTDGDYVSLTLIR